MLLLEILLSIIAAIAFMSFVEYYLHGYFMHQRFLPEFVYRLLPSLEGLYTAHAIEHHKQYYQTFNHEEDPRGREINIKIKLAHPIIGTLIILPFAIPFALYISPIAPLALIATFFIHRLIWNMIHAEMHQPKYPWWTKSALYMYLARYHFLHHKRLSRNINVVLPFADFIMRRHAVATAEEEQRMVELKFLLGPKKTIEPSLRQ